MLGINMDDVMTTLGILQNYLIALAVFLVLAIVVTIAAIKIKKPLKGLVRGTSWVAFVMVLVIIVDLILTGPMYSMVSMVFRPASEISEESITEASALGEEIANEGFVLLKNDGILPLSSGAKVNTFGWSSTNPVYGGTGGYMSIALPSIGKTQQIDCDGPASINNNFNGQASIGFPAGVVIAATWNVELAREFGRSIGEMADEMDVSGWYAPAMNIHRSAFSGRNFEYYSEDGYISGAMASNAVLGASESGVYAFIKHFALNDQETNRNSMLCTWSNEQAIREIYLKPFEMCVKSYDFAAHDPMAVMSAFNYIGYRWAGATPQLLNNVLRDEWGFIGMVLTDYFGGYGCMDADIAIRSGNDFCLTPQMTSESTVTDQTSATSVLAMRQASKNILYTTANSRAYASGINGNIATWEIVMYVISAVIIIAAIVCEVLLIKSYLGKKKKNA